MIETKTKRNLSKENSLSMDLIRVVEEKFLKTSENIHNVEIGDIVRIGYIIPEGDKERTQYYEGVVIAKQNKGLGKSFTIRRSVQGVGVEQVFLVHSPKIVSIVRKQASKVRRAKLYYLRNLTGKSTRLKAKL
jgi:large subunit ribosomal protein L19